ncbi:MAG: hypothetical protein IJV62_03320 [Eggerthellaceae bacterium]|nr:hypothetical protein [Eggerthellaceae bacterium]
MEIPIDIKALAGSIADVSAAREIPLSVSILLDEAAPADLIAFVRSSFASASPQARVSINYFSSNQALFDEKSDLVVVAAGITQEVGRIVADIRAASIPVLIVTTLPSVVKQTAQLTGFPLLEKDVIAPEIHDGDVVSLRSPIVVKSSGASENAQEAYTDIVDLEPVTLDENVSDYLHNRMGEWVVAVFKEKRLAFAQAFPFVRRPLANDAITATSLENAGVGVVAFIPGADMPIMTANQMKMVLQIAAAYGQDLNIERVKELLAILAGGFALRGAARQALSVVPVLGWAIKGAIGYTGTYAMGKAAIEYFEGGANLVGVSNVVTKGVNSALGLARNVGVAATGQQRVQDVVASVAKQAASKAYTQVAQSVKEAPQKVAEYTSKGKDVAAEIFSKNANLSQ